MAYIVYPVLHDLNNTYDRFLDKYVYLGRVRQGMLLVDDEVRRHFGDALTQGTWTLGPDDGAVPEIACLRASRLTGGTMSVGVDYNPAMGAALLVFDMNTQEFRTACMKTLEQVRAQKTGDAVGSFTRAMKLYREGCTRLNATEAFQEAMRHFYKSIDRYRQNPLAYLHLGHIQHYQRRFRDFTKAWDNYSLCSLTGEGDPVFAPVRALGCLYCGWLSAAVLGNLQEAVTWTRKALECRPGIPEAYYHLAKMYALLGDVVEARTCLLELLNNIDPRYCARLKVDPDFYAVKDDFRALIYETAQQHVRELEDALEGEIGAVSSVMQLHARDKLDAAREMLSGNDFGRYVDAIVLVADVWERVRQEQGAAQASVAEDPEAVAREQQRQQQEAQERARAEQEAAMKAELQERIAAEMKARTQAQKERAHRRSIMRTLLSAVVLLLAAATLAAFVLFGLNATGFLLLLLTNCVLLVRALL